MYQSTFIFDSVWPLVKFFQIIGCFPLKKVTINGNITLLPLCNCLYLAISLIPFFVVFICVSTIKVVAFDEFKCFIMIHPAVVDKLAMFGTVVVFQTVHFSLYVNSFSFRHQLVHYQEIFMKKCKPIYLNKNQMRKKIIIMAFVISLIVFISALCVTIGGVVDCFGNLPKGCYIFIIIMFTFMTMFLQGNIHLFLVTYMQITSKLITWTRYVAQNIKHNEQTEVQNALPLLECVFLAKNMFARPLFIIVLGAMTNLILIIYTSISHFIDMELISSIRSFESFIANAFGNISICVMLCIFLYITNDASQSLTNAMSELKSTVMNMPMNENETVIVDGIEHSSVYARFVIVERFSSFKGFTGCEFFDLGRPMLSTVTSNFITYLIILLQFKLSMSPQVENKESD